MTAIGDKVICDRHWQEVFAGPQPATIISEDPALAWGYGFDSRYWVLSCGHWMSTPKEAS